MTFQTIMMWVALGGLVVSLATLAVVWCNERQVFPLRSLLVKFRSLPLVVQIGLGLFIGHLVVYGSTKGSTNAPPMNMMRLMTPRPLTGFSDGQIAAGAAIVRTGTGEGWDFAPPVGATVMSSWLKRGAANDLAAIGCGLPEDGPALIDTFGRIRTSERVYSPLGLKLGIVPEANWSLLGTNVPSLVWWMHTASNSTVVTWQNALLFRETNLPVCVQAEFFEGGRFVYRYDLASIGESASNVFARVMTAAGADGIALGAGVTSVIGHRLGVDDGSVLDKDGDGVATYDEIFVYGTDPELPDTDGDGIPDGEEIAAGTDPLAGDVADEEIVARIAASVTNETYTLVEGELESTKLWDGFAFRRVGGDADAGQDEMTAGETNVLYTRTFAVDRRSGWTSCFLSGRGGEGCSGGEDAIQDWTLMGAVIEWSDDAGASGTVAASPRNDSLYLPMSTSATSVTITLRVTNGSWRHASPSPLYLLVYSPKLSFPGGQEIDGDDGNTYCVFTHPGDVAFSLDNSNRPCHAAAGEGEVTESDFPLPTGAGVYRLPLGERADEDVIPNQNAGPLLTGTLMSPPNGNGDRYLVVIDPWVSYGVSHYGCCHDYPYDWGWFGYWCDCTPECGAGVSGYSAVNAFIDWYDGSSCRAVVEVGGTEVWSGEAYHVVWGCDHDHDEPDGVCPCGCDGDCSYCSCCRSDGPSQGSIRFRVGLGEFHDGHTAGFAWFESDGPVMVTPQLFEIESNPNADVYVSRSGSTINVTTYETNGRDLTISALSNGVTVAVRHHGAMYPYQNWEISNVSNMASVVRLVKRDTGNDVLEDWTYSCAWRSGEWIWDVTDNIDRSYSGSEAGVVTENGTNWVYGTSGRLERLTVGTNDEETVIRTFTYDENGRMTLVDDGTNGCVSITYDEVGNIASMTGPEGTLSAAWDADGILTNLDTSAWNGSIPFMGPRLTAMGDGMTGFDALFHYLYGEGTPVSMPFSEIDTSDLRPIDFDSVKSFVANCHAPDEYDITGTHVISTRGGQQLYIGHMTVRLTGKITYSGHCNWSFNGTLEGLDDRYDFNAATRGATGETLTAIGRLLFEAHGTPFTIRFIGTKPMEGTGHCGD